MYKIDLFNARVADEYANTMALQIKPRIDDYLNGFILECELDDRRIKIGVMRGSLTYSVLSRLSNVDQLELFLKADVNSLNKMVDKLGSSRYPNELIFKKLGKTTYRKYYSGNLSPIDHFNEILYDIFVTNGYERLVDKEEFINNTQLLICPYCGDNKIYESERTRGEIDHFLPKRKYPLFAMCYYNMIPSCHSCNQASHKGQRDPIENWHGGRRILNPYMYDPDIARFSLIFEDTRVFDPSNFEVVVGFRDKKNLDGYDAFFDIPGRYARNVQDVSEDYCRLMMFQEGREFLNEMDVDQAWLQNAYRAVLGYSEESDFPHLKSKYQMRKDVFNQLTNQRTPDRYFVLESGESTTILR